MNKFFTVQWMCNSKRPIENVCPLSRKFFWDFQLHRNPFIWSGDSGLFSISIDKFFEWIFKWFHFRCHHIINDYVSKSLCLCVYFIVFGIKSLEAHSIACRWFNCKWKCFIQFCYCTAACWTLCMCVLMAPSSNMVMQYIHCMSEIAVIKRYTQISSCKFHTFFVLTFIFNRKWFNGFFHRFRFSLRCVPNSFPIWSQNDDAIYSNNASRNHVYRQCLFLQNLLNSMTLK